MAYVDTCSLKISVSASHRFFLQHALYHLIQFPHALHQRLSLSEMELCHLLGYQSRVKNGFQKAESNMEKKNKTGEFIYSFTKAHRIAKRLCYVKPLPTEKGMKIKTNRASSNKPICSLLYNFKT